MIERGSDVEFVEVANVVELRQDIILNFFGVLSWEICGNLKKLCVFTRIRLKNQ